MPARIIVANEPRVYREVLAGALEAQRPGYEIIYVDPDELGTALAEHKPDVVIATIPSEALQSFDGVLMRLYPPEREQLVVSRAGQVLRTIEEADFASVLAVVDEFAGTAPGPRSITTLGLV